MGTCMSLLGLGFASLNTWSFLFLYRHNAHNLGSWKAVPEQWSCNSYIVSKRWDQQWEGMHVFRPGISIGPAMTGIRWLSVSLHLAGFSLLWEPSTNLSNKLGSQIGWLDCRCFPFPLSSLENKYTSHLGQLPTCPPVPVKWSVHVCRSRSF